MQSLRALRTQLELTRYSDYRAYFEDLFGLAKDTFEKYSYVRFAEDLNLGSSNIAFTIIKGKRKLMLKHVRDVSDALGLDSKEHKFLVSLVRLQNSSHVDGHLQDYDTLLDVAESRLREDSSRDAIQFLSAWHHVPVFEALDLFPNGATPQALAKMFRVAISLTAVRDSLERLTHMGLLEKRGNLYLKKQRSLSTGDTVPGFGVVRFHLKMLELARECLSHEFSPNERNVSSVTIAVSEEGAQKIMETLEEFRKRIFSITQADKNLTKVFQVNFQAFPLLEKQPTQADPTAE